MDTFKMLIEILNAISCTDISPFENDNCFSTFKNTKSDLKTKHNETLNTDTFKMSVEILNDLGYTDLSTCEDDKYTDIVEPKM